MLHDIACWPGISLIVLCQTAKDLAPQKQWIATRRGQGLNAEVGLRKYYSFGGWFVQLGSWCATCWMCFVLMFAGKYVFICRCNNSQHVDHAWCSPKSRVCKTLSNIRTINDLQRLLVRRPMVGDIHPLAVINSFWGYLPWLIRWFFVSFVGYCSLFFLIMNVVVDRENQS